MSASNTPPHAGDTFRSAPPAVDYVSDWQVFPETDGEAAPPASDARPDASAGPGRPE